MSGLDAQPPTLDAPLTPNQAAPYGGRFGDLVDLRRHSARGMIVNGIYQIGLAALSAFRGLVAAVFLTTSEYGIWGLLGLALWTVIGLKQVGVNDKYIQQSESDQEIAFQRAFTIELIFSLLAVPLIALVVWAFALLTDQPSIIAPGLALALIAPAAALQFPVWIFYRRMDFRRQRLLQAVDPVVGAIVIIALAAAGFGYWSFVVGAIAGVWAAGLAALRFSPYRLRLRYHAASLRTYFRFSWPLVVAGLATLATFQTIYLVGNEAIGLAGLGAFTVAGNLLQFTNRADAIITETLYPALCAVQDRTAVLFEAFVKSNRLALMWALPFGIGLSLFATDLVRFGIGERWSSAIILLQILGVVMAVQHIGFNWHAFFRARGVTWPIGFAAVASSIVFIAAGIPLMFEFGLAGLGWAFAIAEAVGLTIRMTFLSRLFAGFRPMRHMIRVIWPTAVAAALVLGVRMLGADQETLASAVAQVALFIATTVSITVVVERALLREAFGYFGFRRPFGRLAQDAPVGR